MAATRSPLGLLGGTFDPVHYAHVRLALDALETLPLDEVRWIPSGAPGHRNAPYASAEDRLAMVRLAIAGEPRFTIDTTELDSRTPTYTVPMLRRLRRELGDERPLVMLIGMDSFLSLPTWRDWEALFDLTHFAVAARPGYAFDIDELPASLAQVYAKRQAEPSTLAVRAQGCIVHFPSVLLDISATDLRARIAQQKSARCLIPETVLSYIESKGLYR